MDDVDKVPSFDAGEAPRRSTSSLDDTMERSGKFGRAFIFLNRVFGALCILSGASMIVTALLCLVRGTSLGSSVWTSVGFGVVLTAVGTLYFKAPLFRSSRSADDHDPPK
jgi:hypothetical protein